MEGAGRPTEGGPPSDAKGSALTFGSVVVAWKRDPAFREFWRASLRTIALDAYAWECPPVTAKTVTGAFECVLVASPALARMPQDSGAFAEHFRPDRSVVT